MINKHTSMEKEKIIHQHSRQLVHNVYILNNMPLEFTGLPKVQ